LSDPYTLVIEAVSKGWPGWRETPSRATIFATLSHPFNASETRWCTARAGDA